MALAIRSSSPFAATRSGGERGARGPFRPGSAAQGARQGPEARSKRAGGLTREPEGRGRGTGVEGRGIRSWEFASMGGES